MPRRAGERGSSGRRNRKRREIRTVLATKRGRETGKVEAAGYGGARWKVL